MSNQYKVKPQNAKARLARLGKMATYRGIDFLDIAERAGLHRKSLDLWFRSQSPSELALGWAEQALELLIVEAYEELFNGNSQQRRRKSPQYSEDV